LRMGYCGTFDATPEKLCSKGAASLIAFFTEDRKHKLWYNCYTDRASSYAWVESAACLFVKNRKEEWQSLEKVSVVERHFKQSSRACIVISIKMLAIEGGKKAQNRRHGLFGSIVFMVHCSN
jgi:hypothetical protein